MVGLGFGLGLGFGVISGDSWDGGGSNAGVGGVEGSIMVFLFFFFFSGDLGAGGCFSLGVWSLDFGFGRSVWWSVWWDLDFALFPSFFLPLTHVLLFGEAGVEVCMFLSLWLSKSTYEPRASVDNGVVCGLMRRSEGQGEEETWNGGGRDVLGF